MTGGALTRLVRLLLALLALSTGTNALVAAPGSAAVAAGAQDVVASAAVSSAMAAPAAVAQTTTTPGEEPGVTMRRLPAGGEWVVAPGESFWLAAERVLAEARGAGGQGSVTQAEVAQYWVELIETNRDRLGDPSNADLIYTGQVFVLPSLG